MGDAWLVVANLPPKSMGTDLGLPNFDCSFYMFLLQVTMVMDGMDEGELLESQTHCSSHSSDK